MTTIVSRDFFGATVLPSESLMVFWQLQIGQTKTEQSLVRFKTIRFPHEGQNSIAASSLDNVIGGGHH
jgi:hypothetical protein